MKKYLSMFIAVCFMANSVMPPAMAGQLIAMPDPGTMIGLSPAFTPAHLMGVTIDPKNALKFDFLIHKGDVTLSDKEKRTQYRDLIKYFLAALTVPNDDQWVNLSPYEGNRMIKDNFGTTEMGRDLLAQDYLLKQLTASLMNPESDLGRKFWEQIYEKAQQQFGTTDVPVDTFNKIWITPADVSVMEKGNTALVLNSHLTVMTEKDYAATDNNVLSREGGPVAEKTPAINISAEMVKQILLPAIEKEVNEGKTFANLRQIYGAMILATWFKKTLKESLLGKAYADQSKVNGVNQDPKNNEKIYQQYVEAFKKGVVNMIKEDTDKYTQEVIPRKYFSGGALGVSMPAMAVVPVTQERLDKTGDTAAMANDQVEQARAAMAIPGTPDVQAPTKTAAPIADSSAAMITPVDFDRFPGDTLTGPQLQSLVSKANAGRVGSMFEDFPALGHEEVPMQIQVEWAGIIRELIERRRKAAPAARAAGRRYEQFQEERNERIKNPFPNPFYSEAKVRAMLEPLLKPGATLEFYVPAPNGGQPSSVKYQAGRDFTPVLAPRTSTRWEITLANFAGDSPDKAISVFALNVNKLIPGALVKPYPRVGDMAPSLYLEIPKDSDVVHAGFQWEPTSEELAYAFFFDGTGSYERKGATGSVRVSKATGEVSFFGFSTGVKYDISRYYSAGKPGIKGMISFPHQGPVSEGFSLKGVKRVTQKEAFEGGPLYLRIVLSTGDELWVRPDRVDYEPRVSTNAAQGGTDSLTELDRQKMLKAIDALINISNRKDADWDDISGAIANTIDGFSVSELAVARTIFESSPGRGNWDYAIKRWLVDTWHQEKAMLPKIEAAAVQLLKISKDHRNEGAPGAEKVVADAIKSFNFYWKDLRKTRVAFAWKLGAKKTRTDESIIAQLKAVEQREEAALNAERARVQEGSSAAQRVTVIGDPARIEEREAQKAWQGIQSSIRGKDLQGAKDTLKGLQETMASLRNRTRTTIFGEGSPELRRVSAAGLVESTFELGALIPNLGVVFTPGADALLKFAVENIADDGHGSWTFPESPIKSDRIGDVARQFAAEHTDGFVVDEDDSSLDGTRDFVFKWLESHNITDIIDPQLILLRLNISKERLPGEKKPGVWDAYAHDFLSYNPTRITVAYNAAQATLTAKNVATTEIATLRAMYARDSIAFPQGLMTESAVAGLSVQAIVDQLAAEKKNQEADVTRLDAELANPEDTTYHLPAKPGRPMAGRTILERDLAKGYAGALQGAIDRITEATSPAQGVTPAKLVLMSAEGIFNEVVARRPVQNFMWVNAVREQAQKTLAGKEGSMREWQVVQLMLEKVNENREDWREEFIGNELGELERIDRELQNLQDGNAAQAMDVIKRVADTYNNISTGEARDKGTDDLIALMNRSSDPQEVIQAIKAQQAITAKRLDETEASLKKFLELGPFNPTPDGTNREIRDYQRWLEAFKQGVTEIEAALAGSAEQTALRGGIDFNEQYLKMNIKRDGNGMILPVAQQDMENIKINGLVPVILDIQPVHSLAMLAAA